MEQVREFDGEQAYEKMSGDCAGAWEKMAKSDAPVAGTRLDDFTRQWVRGVRRIGERVQVRVWARWRSTTEDGARQAERARQVERARLEWARQETARQSKERRGPERSGPERDFGPSR